MFRFPVDAFNIPEIFRLPPSVTPAELLIVRLLIVLEEENVLAGIVCADVPFITIVPFVSLKIPLFEMVPDICSVPPFTITDPPLAIVMLLTDTVPVVLVIIG